MPIETGKSQMFAQAKLAVLDGSGEARHSDGSEELGSPSHYPQSQASGRENYTLDDLNRSNRPVRTRMPGGVGGARSVRIAPYPDFLR